MLTALSPGLDILGQAGGLFLGLARVKIGLLLRFIHSTAAVDVQITGVQHQLNAVRLGGFQHGAAGFGGFGFQLNGAVVGHGRQRRGRFFCIGQVRVHQHQPRVVGVKGIGGAVVAGCFKALRSGQQGVYLRQQPEDAFGHQGHHSRTDQ